MTIRKPISYILLALALIFLSCKSGDRIYKKSSVVMDTLVSITVVSESGDMAEKAIDNALSEIKKLEELMSFWSEDSEIATIYRNAGDKPVKISPLTLDLIEKSLYVSDKTYGAFDPTIGPVMRLWDFKSNKLPDSGELKDKLPLVNYKEISVNKSASTVFLRKKGMSFDTGGILKGYAADMAVDALKKEGIKSGLVAIAGDIKGFGTRPEGGGWRIGIRNPRNNDKNDEISAVFELRDEAVSTSGDYERFFIEEGKRYHHILNPRTGYPARGCRSVSVISKEAYITDGFSTGLFVMGPEKAKEMARNLGINAVIVDEEGKIYVTDGIKDRVQIKIKK